MKITIRAQHVPASPATEQHMAEAEGVSVILTDARGTPIHGHGAGFFVGCTDAGQVAHMVARMLGIEDPRTAASADGRTVDACGEVEWLAPVAS